MAAPIVRTFVIDTSQAEQSLKSLNVVSAATQATIDALYSELIKLDTALSGVAPDSAKFTELSASIAQVEASINTIETGKLQDVATDLQGIGAAANKIDTANIEKLEGAIDDVAPAASASAKAIDDIAGSMQEVAPAAAQTATAFDDISDSVKQVDGTKLGELEEAQTQVEGSTKSLKAQLKELQVELANTDPDSAKYRELAAAAGEVKDQIGDAAEAVGTQAGGAFEKVSGSLGLVTGRIANLDFQGAAEGAKLLAENITDIKPGDITKGIKGIGSALGSVGKALLTNPLFLIGAAIAAAVIYSKELLSLIDGVTDADKALLEVQKEKTAQAKQQFDAIGQQEESLKRQGFTEEEILQKKLEALDLAILTAKVTAETTEAQAQGQIDAAKRNKTILEGLLNFISLPLTALLAGVDLLTEGLNKAGLLSDETFAKVGNLRKQFTSSVAGLLFDPAKVEEETKAATEAAKKGVKDLENTRDGLLNSRDAKNKAANEKAAATSKAAADKEAADAKAAADKIAADKLQALEQYYAKSNEIADEQFKNSLLKNEQEELAVVQKYEALFALADKAKQDTKQLQKDLNAELIALEVNQKKELKKATDDAYAEQVKKIRDIEELRISFLEEGVEKEIAISNLKFARLQDQAGADAELKKQIAKQNQDEVDAITIAGEEKKRQEQLATVNQGIELAQGAVNAIQGISDAAFANKLAKVKKGSKEEEALFKKQFQFNKKLQLAGATMDAAKAVTASIAAAPLAILAVPNPVGIASAAFAAATGLASIAKIAATKYESPGSTSSSPPPSLGGGGGGDTGSQPAQFNPLASSFLQDRPDQVTPRAYVLAGDVASQQEVREKVQDLARIG